MNNETLSTYFPVKTPNRREHCLIICPKFLPFKWQLLDRHCSYKSFNFHSFSGHPPKTGSFAKLLVFWLLCPKISLWYFVDNYSGKKKDLATLDNAITPLLTLQFMDIFFCMTTGFLHDYLSERLPCWEEHTKQDRFFKYVPTSEDYILTSL